MRELRSMLAWVGTRHVDFHVFVGDFNTLAPGDVLHWRQLPMRLRPMVWLSGGSVRYQTIQIMLAAGYIDGFRHLHRPEERGYTFPTWDPHVRLDFVFLPEPFGDRLKQCERADRRARLPGGVRPLPAAGRVDDLNDFDLTKAMWVMRRATGAALALALGLALCLTDSHAHQKARTPKRGAKTKAAQSKAKPAEPSQQSELARLRAQFIEATKELKASLGRDA